MLELTEANRRLRRKIFDLYTIFELSRNFNAVLNYETLLDSFVLTSMGQMGAAKAALYLPLEIGKKGISAGAGQRFRALSGKSDNH